MGRGPIPGRRTVPEPATRRRVSPDSRRPVTGMRGGWERLSECVQRALDPELFFPGVGEEIDPGVFAACSACQVRQQCLRRSLAVDQVSLAQTGYRFGIWGGLTPRQRTNLIAGRTVRTSIPTGERNRYKKRTVAGAALKAVNS